MVSANGLLQALKPAERAALVTTQNSLTVMLLSTTTAVLLGFVYAYAMVYSRMRWKPFFRLIALLPLHAQVVINEISASNRTGLTDAFGQREDWVEIYNPTLTPVSIGGWYLTDNASDLRKWRFPTTAPTVTLAAGARIVVWCSEKNRKANARNALRL